MATTICMLNQKGGVGKTSCCHHLAGALSKQERRVLLLDMDPQANLTQGFLGSEAAAIIPPASSVAALFDDQCFWDPKTLIQPTNFAELFLVPGSPAMRRYDPVSPHQAGEKQLVLRDFIAEVGGDFDVIFIDCGPSLYLCSWAALVASNYVIVPLQAEAYGAQGIVLMQEAIAAIQAGPNDGLKLMGYLITMRNKRAAIHQKFETALREMYGQEVFTNTVPLSVTYKEAVSEGIPVGYYKPRGEAAAVMDRLAVEILERAAGSTTAKEAA